MKERRPTISPNFNFLGQLQLFQGTLPLNTNSDPVTKQPTCPTPGANSSTGEGSKKPNPTVDNNHVDKSESTGESKNLQSDMSNRKASFTLSLSDKLRDLNLNIEASSVAPQKPTHLQLPSLLEKRKSLTLSLTPLCTSPQTSPTDASLPKSTTHSNETHPSDLVSPAEANTSTATSTKHGKSRSQKRRSSGQITSSLSDGVKEERNKPKRERRKKRSSSHTQSACPSSSGQQAETGADHTGDAVEVDAGDQSLLSPINLTITRLLGWGERMLLGVLLGPHIKVGQASLPYRC